MTQINLKQGDATTLTEVISGLSSLSGYTAKLYIYTTLGVHVDTVVGTISGLSITYSILNEDSKAYAIGLHNFETKLFDTSDHVYTPSCGTFNVEKSISTDDLDEGAPSSLVATPYSTTQVNLTWNSNTNNQDGYSVERSTDNVSFAVAGTSTTATYSDTGRTAGTLYYYRVRAYIGSKYSGYSSVATATTFVVITPPASFDWTLPFDIQRSGTTIQVDPTFDIQTRAGITVSKTYYVDSTSGSEYNDGSSWAKAFKYLKTAQNRSDVDRIYCKGEWDAVNHATEHTRSMEIIGVGTAKITSYKTTIVGDFTKISNYYRATISEYIAAVSDLTNIDDGWEYRLKPVTSIAEVDGELNTVFVDWDNTYIYVRTFDDRAPDVNIKYSSGSVFDVTSDNLTYYFENMTMSGSFSNNSATGGLKVYFKDCKLSSVIFYGCDESIMENCDVLKMTDGDRISYKNKNGLPNKGIEINCEAGNTETTSTNQASTAHDACRIVRINGTYRDTIGQNVADVGTSMTWMLGCNCSGSTGATASLNFADTNTAWLEECSSNNIYDIINTVGCATYIRNFHGSGTNTIVGTLTAY